MNIDVSTLVRYLKIKLDTDEKMQRVNVIGEISNFHAHQSGHLYFTLKDAFSQIDCVMFKSSSVTLKFIPKNGDKVVANANVSIFENAGKLQLYVNRMMLDGIGDLFAQYQFLKEKLEKQGYFNPEHKKILPKKFIEKVAVLVGANSAAMSDIKKCFKRRWPYCEVDFYPVLVQGEGAANNIINVLKEVDNLNYDAIILSRGGGSFEDLFCFNDENLVKTIYDLKTFIITGIGHEQDFTLADFVADVRAATPTAAVEVITPSIEDIYVEINKQEIKLKSLINNKLYDAMMKYDLLNEKLNNQKNKLITVHKQIENYIQRMRLLILNHIQNNKNTIYNMNYRLSNIIHNTIEKNKLFLKRNETLLNAYGINETLKRGYVLAFQDDKLIKKKAELVMNKDLKIKFIDGTVVTMIKE